MPARLHRLRLDVINHVHKLIISMSLYLVICNLVIYVATMDYQQTQPVGLIIVGMVFIPVVITIFGGLPLDFMSKERQE